MSLTRLASVLIMVFTISITLACSLFIPDAPQPEATLNSLYTAAAETLNVMSTQGAATQPGNSPTATLSIPTNSPTAFATFTSVPPLQTVAKCDAAEFVADVTYPDGSLVGRGNPFTKTWRIRNTGTCTWTPAYSLIFVSGERLGGKNAVALPANVGPGRTVDVSVQLTAPNQEGRYRGYWKLRSAAGFDFGFGLTGESTIYVDVSVSGYTVTGYDLASNLCDARWQNSEIELPCPGKDGAGRGFAIFMSAPQMEDGKVRGAGLLTHPQMVDNGTISGKYPAVSIQSGDHFQALIGCLNEANDCDMTFKLEYQVGSDPLKLLGQWREIYEGGYYPIDIDLSFLNGQKVKFILTILANGSSHEDYGLWVAPRVSRQSAQPPTATLTATLSPTVTVTPSPTLTATPVTPSATATVPTNTPVTETATTGP